MTHAADRRSTIVVGLVAVLAVGLLWGIAGALGVTASESPAASGDKVVLQIGWQEQLDNLNPFIGYQSISYAVYFENYDLLVNYDPDTLEPVPGLAESWETSDDGKVWTFTLRKDAVWHDGEPVTADDVAFTYNYVVDNEMGAFTTYTNAVKQTTALDDYTVQVETTEPKAGMLQMWIPILPEHIWSKIDPDDAANSYPNSPPCVGSGPYQVVEWKKSEFVRMAANKEYWGGAPKVDELIFRFYTNQDTMTSDLKLGAIQYAAATPTAIEPLDGTEGLTVNKAQDDTFENIGFNCYEGPSKGHPAVRDPAFRRALNWAVDRELIAEIAYAGGAVPASGFLPSGYWKDPVDYHWEPSADEKYTYDPERAKQELDAAGYTDTDGDGVRDYKGEPIELRLWAVDDKPEATNVGKIVTTSLEEVGIKVDLRSVDDGTASDGMYNYEGDVFTPDYDMFIWYWTGDFDPGFLLSIFTSDQIESWSDCNWSNEEYDELFRQQDTELDPEARKQLIWRMQEIVYDETPYLVPVYSQTLEAYNTAEWEGWVEQPADSGTVLNSWSYLKVGPRTEAAADDDGGNGIWIFVAAAAAAVIAIVVWLVARGRGKAVEEA